MTEVLVTGETGLLGSTFVRLAEQRGMRVIGTHRRKSNPGYANEELRLDFPNLTPLETLLESENPDYVINCAAITNVDACESQPERATAVNAKAPGKIAELCSRWDVGICQISTDYVFSDGDGSAHAETDSTDPIQIYGQTKRKAELLCFEHHRSPLVTRVSFLYGENGLTTDLQGLPAWILDRVRADGEVPLFDDQRISPTNAQAAASTILDLIEEGSTGVFHCSDKGCVTPYEFGEYFLANVASTQWEHMLRPISLSEADLLADRPNNVCLSVEAVEWELGRPQEQWDKTLGYLED